MQGPGAVLNVITIPPGAGLTERIVIDGLRGAIFEYDNSNNLVGSWANAAGTDPYGHTYPMGLSITGSGFFSGTIVAGNITNTPITSSSITNSDFSGGTIESTSIQFDATGGRLLVYITTNSTTTFNTSGTFNNPVGNTLAKVECIAGAGRGSVHLGTGGNGGGGAEYSQDPSVALTPSTAYPVTVGTGGVGLNSDGTASSFTGDATTVTANPGHGDGSPGTGSTNPIHFAGGSGGQGVNNGGGGGGGAAGSPLGAGANGHNASGNNGGAGGIGVGGSGSGGNGGNKGVTGSNGVAPGGGAGGGGSGIPGLPGTAANGQVRITIVTGRTLLLSITPAGGTDPFGNTYGAGLTLYNSVAPALLASAVQVFSGSGQLEYVSGADGNAYDTGRLTAPATGPLSLSTTMTTIPGMSAPLGVGTYHLRGQVYLQNPGTAGQGAPSIRLQPSGGLTASAGRVAVTEVHAANGVGLAAANSLGTTLTGAAPGTGGADQVFRFDAVFVISVAGTVSVQMSQAATAASTILQYPSFLEVFPVT